MHQTHLHWQKRKTNNLYTFRLQENLIKLKEFLATLVIGQYTVYFLIDTFICAVLVQPPICFTGGMPI